MDIGRLAQTRQQVWTPQPGAGFTTHLSDDDSPTGMRGTNVGIDMRAVDMFNDRSYQHVRQSEHRNRELVASLSDRATQPGVQAFAAARQKRESAGEQLLRETMLRAVGAARDLPFARGARDDNDNESAEREVAEARLALQHRELESEAPARDENDELISTTALPAPVRAAKAPPTVNTAEDVQPPDPAPWWIWVIVALTVVLGVGLIAGIASARTASKLGGGSYVFHPAHGSHFVEAAGSLYERR